PAPEPAVGPEPSAGPPAEAVEVMAGPQIAMRPGRGGAELVVDWPAPVAAASFERGGVLWLVFDAVAPAATLAALADDPEARKWLGSIETLAHPDLTVLRLRPSVPVRGLERR